MDIRKLGYWETKKQGDQDCFQILKHLTSNEIDNINQVMPKFRIYMNL